MRNLINLSGQKFGKYLVEGDYYKEGHNTYWLCLCECGIKKYVSSYSLRKGTSKSCGCSRKNDMRKHFLFELWRGIVKRCNNPKSINYKYYGGRGITICNRWLDFKLFLDDMFSTWEDGLSIDRIDVNGNYEPQNCKWATLKSQQRNRRDSIILEYKNKTQTLSDWAEELKINKKC